MMLVPTSLKTFRTRDAARQAARDWNAANQSAYAARAVPMLNRFVVALFDWDCGGSWRVGYLARSGSIVAA